MKAHRWFIRAFVVALTMVLCSVVIAPAVAQTPAPTTTATAPAETPEGAAGAESPASAAVPDPGPPASYYASYGLIAIGGLTILAVLAGYLFQAPGFRRSKGASS